MKERTVVAVSVVLLFLNAGGALPAGWSLMTDPSGTGLGLPAAWLAQTPFSNFFIPGLLLFLVNGLASLVVLLAIAIKGKQRNEFILLEGVLLSGWIVMQLLLTQKFHPLQVVMGLIGLVLTGNGWWLMAKARAGVACLVD